MIHPIFAGLVVVGTMLGGLSASFMVGQSEAKPQETADGHGTGHEDGAPDEAIVDLGNFVVPVLEGSQVAEYRTFGLAALVTDQGTWKKKAPLYNAALNDILNGAIRDDEFVSESISNGLNVEYVSGYVLDRVRNVHGLKNLKALLVSSGDRFDSQEISNEETDEK